MVTLTNWVVEIIKISALGVVIYSICDATNHRGMANMAKYLAILLIAQTTLFTIAKPAQSISKKATEIEAKFDKLNEGILGKIIWFGADPNKVNPDNQLLQSPKK